jgi:DNA-binding SARP family transcriptional activator
LVPEGFLVLRLHIFGDPRLTDESGQTVAFPEKAILALVYLSTRQAAWIARVEIANFLWGEHGSVNALANLRQLLARVKARQKELGEVLFVIRETEIGYNAESFHSDIAALREAECMPPLQAIEGFQRYFNGEFLAGIDASSEAAQIWLQAERARLLSRYAFCLEAAASDENLATHSTLIKDAAFRLVELDAYSEIAYRVLLKALASDGHLSQARALFSRYKDRLWKDLHAAPDPEMLDLTRQLFDTGTSAVAAAPRSRDPAVFAQSIDLRQAKVRLPRLLLMPPRDPGQDQQQAYLSAGLLEDVTIGLCRARTISVVAPFTAQRIATEPQGRADAYRRHDVSYVLETRLGYKSGDLTLFAELVHLPGDQTIWADRFDVSPGHLPRSYDMLVQRIAATVIGKIEHNEFGQIAPISTPDAYQHFLLGQHHLKTIDLPDVRRARKAFRAALRQAPDFSNALSGLARSEHLEWLLTARGDRELLRSAESHSLKAILADRDNAGGYHQLGVTKLYLGAFDESIDAFRGAEQSAPSHADLIADYADTLVHASDPKNGLAKIEQAIELNPLCPDLYWWTAAGANYSLERYQDALHCLDHVADQSHIYRFAAACWGMLGERRKALALMRRTMEIHPGFEVEKWLAIIPFREHWQRDLYREGLRKAGFN